MWRRNQELCFCVRIITIVGRGREVRRCAFALEVKPLSRASHVQPTTSTQRLLAHVATDESIEMARIQLRSDL